MARMNWDHAEKLTIPPSTKAITAMIHNEGMTLRKAISELIANALDQAATQIDINLEPYRIGVNDNGNGCSRLQDMLRLGESFGHGRSSIGRYGVGFKDAVIFFGDRVEVHSLTREGKRSSARANWQEMIAGGDWEAKFINDSDRTESGVTIIISELRRERLADWDEVPEYISALFSAAIDVGVSICLDGIRIKAIPVPELEDEISFRGDFAGKKFDGFCGILRDRHNVRSGWEVRWGPLTICQGYQKDGFHNYSPQGFYGRLLLKDDREKWTLTRNKTVVTELGALLNSKEIQDIIRPILEKLKQRGQTLQMKLNQKIAQQFCQKFLQSVKVRPTNEQELQGLGDSGLGGKMERKTKKNLGLKAGDKLRSKRKPDETAKLRERLERANDIQILPHDSIAQYGIGYVDITENGTIVKIFIEEETAFGQWLWTTAEGSPYLQHYAVGLFAQHVALNKEGTQMEFFSTINVETAQLESQRIAKVWAFCTLASNFHLFEKVSSKAA
jgi:Histidine kinase-, DNA gyrase B-, and HSP90-like ATPase